MVDRKYHRIEPPSLDEQIRKDGYILLETIPNRDFVQVTMKHIKYLNSGYFIIIPENLAYPGGSKNSHNLYIKENLDAENSKENELEKKVLQPVS